MTRTTTTARAKAAKGTADEQPTDLPLPLTTVPDVCSLTPSAFEERMAFILREIAPHATAPCRLENGIAWDFEARPELRTQLEALVRLERDCCAGLTFEVWENPDAGRLRFEILGIDPDSTLLEQIGWMAPDDATADRTPAEAVRGDDSKTTVPAWMPLARRGGLAALVALAVCCVAPIVLVSVLGVAAAAPLSTLDHPLAIAGMTVALMTMLWLLEKRRGRDRLATGSEKDTGCGC